MDLLQPREGVWEICTCMVLCSCASLCLDTAAPCCVSARARRDAGFRKGQATWSPSPATCKHKLGSIYLVHCAPVESTDLRCIVPPLWSPQLLHALPLYSVLLLSHQPLHQLEEQQSSGRHSTCVCVGAASALCQAPASLFKAASISRGVHYLWFHFPLCLESIYQINQRIH